MIDPYTPPASALTLDTEPPPFKRVSVWLVIGLSIITLGLYCIYWIYTRTNQLSRLEPKNKNIMIYTNFVLALFLLTFLIVLLEGFIPYLQSNDEFLRGLNLLSNLSILLWSIKFRNALNIYTGAKKGEKLWSNLFLAFFFQVYYHQYKINQILASDNEVAAGNIPELEIPDGPRPQSSSG